MIDTVGDVAAGTGVDVANTTTGTAVVASTKGAFATPAVAPTTESCACCNKYSGYGRSNL